MGGRANTQDFLRLFMIPGMNHCMGGIGEMNVDWLGQLETWVENGKAPATIIGTHTGRGQDAQTFTRPLYPYPAYARYKGHGDPMKAENFAPVQAR